MPRGETWSARRSLADALTADARQTLTPSPAWARWLTTPMSWIYRLAAMAHGRLGMLRPPRRLPGTVISVGNLAAGGTGKSPVVAAIGQLLVSRGHKVAILTRGYGSGLGAKDSLAYLAGNMLMAPEHAHAPLGAGVRADEAVMQSMALPGVPVVVGAARYQAARRFLDAFPAHAPAYWLLDDGFQHHHLARDLDVVLLDAAKPLGNGRLLPRGPLRESAAALARAHLVIFTRASDRAPDAESRALVRQCFSGPTLTARFVAGALTPTGDARPFDVTRHGVVMVVCGIARPDQFIDQVRARGIKITSTYVVGDHQPLSVNELQRRAKGARAVVTTAKDYWRDPAAFAGLTIPVYVQELGVEVDAAAMSAALGPVLDRS